MSKERGARGGQWLLLAISLVGLPWSFLTPSPRSVDVQRRAEVDIEVPIVDPVEKLCGKLPLLTGRKNHTEESLNFKVVGSKVGTTVQLSLPPLQYWQYVQGQGKTLRSRHLPMFESNADSLVSAKEQAAEAALSALFRIMETRLSSSNSQKLSQVMTGIFNDDVEVAQIRFPVRMEESHTSPGNFLYTLAYLSRETYADSPSKRILTASHVSPLPDKPDWWQVLVQQKQRLVMPQKTPVEKVSSETQPNNLAAYMEKALREKGAVKLQVVGTEAAEQALTALKDLNQWYTHRFCCYFMHGNFANATGLEVHVARRWRPLT